MRKAILIPALLFVLVPACGDDGGKGSDTDGETDSGTGGTGTTTATGGATESGTGGTTGGQSSLVPCDPLVENDCETGVCAGEPSNGFYCRLGCPSMAAVGDPCGDGGVCLDANPLEGNTDLACFELDDCDFMTGAGCNLAAGESCVVIDQDPLRTACVPSGNKGAGEQCKPNGMHECSPGLACLGSDLDDGQHGVCTGWCVPGDPLPDDCPACQEITVEIGSCAECSVVVNDCPDGSQCQPINEALGGICVDFGPGGDGDGCNPIDAANSCLEGFLCMEVSNDVFQCVQKCDPLAPMCDDAEKDCNDIGFFNPNYPSGELGLCIDLGGMLCNPDGMPTGCGMDQICLEIDVGVGLCSNTCDPTDGDLACMGNYTCFPIDDANQFFVPPFATGNGACGTGCTSDADCGGATCLLLDGVGTDGVCGTTCTPANPTECAQDESCVPSPADPQVGACVVGGTSCDPTDDIACAGLGGACIALDGMATTGTCIPMCFVQDPNACGTTGGTCHEKTGAQWHSGACLGQDTACDAAHQTGCPAGSTCAVLGGGPFGGTAFICDSAGMVGDGGDCSMDTDVCGEGLLCLQDVCRAYCDPAADNCQTGTCTDISANFYLPADTVGACL